MDASSDGLCFQRQYTIQRHRSAHWQCWLQIQLWRADERTLAGVDSDNNRIRLLSLNDGSFIDNITTGSDTRLLSAVYDGTSWYRSEATFDYGKYEWVNSSVRQYTADGRTLLAEYATAARAFHVLAIGGGGSSGKGQRLYAVDGRREWW